jgi:hypothetical protein
MTDQSLERSRLPITNRDKVTGEGSGFPESSAALPSKQSGGFGYRFIVFCLLDLAFLSFLPRFFQ